MRALVRFIDGTNMYRLMVIYLAAILAAAFGLGLMGRLPEDPADLALAVVLVVAVSEGANRLFARLWDVPANRESTLITALLIVTLMPPAAPDDAYGLAALGFAALWGVASKYLLAWRGRHVFNPAALGVALTGTLTGAQPTWWAGGSMVLVPVVALGGLAILMKIRRSDVVVLAVLANVATVWALGLEPDARHAVTNTLLHTPILFLALTMLTEPLTRPHGRWQRWVFALGTGALAVPVLPIQGFYMRPELAILAGNLFAFLTAPLDRVVLTLRRVEQTSATGLDFLFAADRPLRFRPGQYLDWTLPLRDADRRGNRRTFTIASAPGAEEMRLGVRVPPDASAFKRALAGLRVGDRVHAGQLGGQFVLPRDPGRKVALIAGGIGVTPFRAMVEDLLIRGERRNLTLICGNPRLADVAYADLFDRAAADLGIRVVHVLQSEASPPPGMRAGMIDAGLIRAEVPDWAERIFYVSGPPVMVRALRRALRGMGVPWHRIRTDFFPGVSA